MCPGPGRCRTSVAQWAVALELGRASLACPLSSHPSCLKCLSSRPSCPLSFRLSSLPVRRHSPTVRRPQSVIEFQYFSLFLGSIGSDHIFTRRFTARALNKGLNTAGSVISPLPEPRFGLRLEDIRAARSKRAVLDVGRIDGARVERMRYGNSDEFSTTIVSLDLFGRHYGVFVLQPHSSSIFDSFPLSSLSGSAFLPIREPASPILSRLTRFRRVQVALLRCRNSGACFRYI